MCFVFRSMLEHNKDSKAKLLQDLAAGDSGLCPALRHTVPYGVACHNASLTGQQRRLIEEAYQNKTLCVFTCTSMLATGVNLSAKRYDVILSNHFM